MRTIIEILNLSIEYLEKKKIAAPRREAQELIADALKLTPTQLYMEHDRPLQQHEIDMIRARLARRAEGEPGAYIHGEVAFYGCTLKITPAVIIPRQETEILADRIAKELENEDLKGKALWDVCCGSGALGISLKKKFPDLAVTLSDISTDALAVAKENAALNHADVQFVQGDLLQPFEGRKTDFFVCNPPYISEEEYHNLDREVRDFEPRHALVSGDTGLEFYARLARELPPFLNPGAKVWMEIGTGQGGEIIRLFGGKGKVDPDWAGHDRFFTLDSRS